MYCLLKGNLTHLLDFISESNPVAARFQPIVAMSSKTSKNLKITGKLYTGTYRFIYLYISIIIAHIFPNMLFR